jgi:hypothetical protein
MNIEQCRRGTLPGNLECIFRIKKKDSRGKETYFGCLKHGGKPGRDHYNLYPEHSGDTMDYVYQPSNPLDPYKLGEIILAWENLTSHQSGRNFDLKSERPADIHPLYTAVEHNYPTVSHMAPDTVGEIFGEESPALVHPGWQPDAIKFYGLNNIDVCQQYGGIYGKYDQKKDMIMHQCLKSHIEIPGWINYTNRKETPNKKELYIGYATMKEILDFTTTLFKNRVVASRMFDAMMLIKAGTFINLWCLMVNNFVDKDTKTAFMSKVSIDTPNTIFKSKINIIQFYELYNMIDRMTWTEKIVDVDGNTNEVKKTIHKDIATIYKENILNWILNHPHLQTIEPGLSHYGPTDRFWFLLPLLKRARKDGILNVKAILPPWLVNLLTYKHTPVAKVFGKVTTYDQFSEELKGEYADGKYSHLDSKSPMEIFSRSYPGMINIKKELLSTGDRKIDSLGWGQFLEILKVGQRWSMIEIEEAFDKFLLSWTQDDPSIFFEWLDDEEFPPSGAFVINILNAILPCITEEGPIQRSRNKAWNTWTSWDDWNIVKMPIGNWFDASVKTKSTRPVIGHDVFWRMAAAIGGLVDDRKEIEKILTSSTYEEAMESLLSSDPVIDTEDDNDDDSTYNLLMDAPEDQSDDYGISVYCPSDGSYHNSRGDIWLGEE